MDERHALYVGWVLGLALLHEVPAHPVLDDAGNYTNELEVELFPTVLVTLVVPPPPLGWELTDDPPHALA